MVTHFASLKVQGHVAQEMSGLQMQMANKCPRLRRCLIPSDKLHVTMALFTLSDDNEEQELLDGFSAAGSLLSGSLQNFPENRGRRGELNVQFQGLEHFQDGKVLFGMPCPFL